MLALTTSYKVAVTNEDWSPLIGVEIEAMNLTTLMPDDVQRTGLDGVAIFTGLTGGPHFFKVRDRRVSTAISADLSVENQGRVRSYIGAIHVQVIAMGNQGIAKHYVVDANGLGTHTTVQAACTAATAAMGIGEAVVIYINPGTHQEAVVVDASDLKAFYFVAEGAVVDLWAGNYASIARIKSPATGKTGSVINVTGTGYAAFHGIDIDGDLADIGVLAGDSAHLEFRNCRIATSSGACISSQDRVRAFDSILSISTGRILTSAIECEFSHCRLNGDGLFTGDLNALVLKDCFLLGTAPASEYWIHEEALVVSRTLHIIGCRGTAGGGGGFVKYGAASANTDDVIITNNQMAVSAGEIWCRLEGILGGVVTDNIIVGVSATDGSTAIELNVGTGRSCGALVVAHNSIRDIQNGLVAGASATDGTCVIGPNAFYNVGTNTSGVPDDENYQVNVGDLDHVLLDADLHTDTVAQTVTAGSLIFGNDTPAWDELVISVPAANVRNVLGVDNGETVPSWKTALDGTNPADIAGSASPGTSLVFAHRDHVHKHPTGLNADLHHTAFTAADHTTIGDSSPHHAAITLAADADVLLSLSGQALGFDTQTANTVLAGPTSGGAADPTFRALVAADIPDVSGTYMVKSIFNAKGDLLSATADDTPAILSVGTDDKILMARASETTGLIWIDRSGTAQLANVAATESAGTDDTVPRGDHAHALGIGTTRGDLLIWNDTPVASRLAIGGAGTLLQSDGTDPAWVALATAVGHALLDGSVHTDSVADAVTRGSLVYGNATPKWDELVKGTSGYFLKAGADDIAWAAIVESDISDLQSYVLAHAMLDGSVHNDSVADAVTRGSLIYGNATPKWDELVIGAAARILQSDGSDPSWVAVSGDATIAAGGAVTVAATHSGSAHHAQAHGPSDHTEGTAWRMVYQDASGDEVEIVLGADGTFLESNGASAAPAFRALVEADIGDLQSYVLAHALLDGSVHTDSVADAVTAGSIIIGNDTPKWDELVIAVPAANVRNVLGIDNGETTPSWKTALDGTNPAAVAATASAGTSLVFAHRDHVHALGVGTTRGDILVWNATPVASRLALGAAGTVLIGGASDPSYSGSPALSGTLTVDAINEYTGAAGVTVESVLLKDGGITLGGDVVVTRGAAGRLLVTGTGDDIVSVGDANFGLNFASGSPLIVLDVNDYWQYVRATNTLNFAIGGAVQFSFASETASYPRGAVILGTDDTLRGLLTLYGHTTGAADGGEVRFHLSADHDGTFEYWLIKAEEDDLTFASSNGAAVNKMTPAGQLQLLIAGSGAGLLIGGDANLYRSAADILKTDDSLQVGAVAAIGGLASVDTAGRMALRVQHNTGDCTLLPAGHGAGAYIRPVFNSSAAAFGYGLTGEIEWTGTGANSYALALAFNAIQNGANLAWLYGIYITLVSYVDKGTITSSHGLEVVSDWQGNKPATFRGVYIRGHVDMAIAYGIDVEDFVGTTIRLLEIGPATPYLRLVGGANPAANQTNLYLKEEATLRQVQWKAGDALGAGDKVMVLV